MTRLVIVGGGFAGLWSALSARKESQSVNQELDITLVSPSPYLVMRPRLYEADPEQLRVPLAPTLDPVSVRIEEGTVTSVAPNENRIEVVSSGNNKSLSYDALILTPGSQMQLPSIPGAKEHGWSVDTYEEAIAFDKHLARLSAEQPSDACFVVVGAGFTGIELALELRSRLRAHGADKFAQDARILLVDQADTVGPDLGEGPRPQILEALDAAQVTCRLDAKLASIGSNYVEFETGEHVAAIATILNTGLRASPLLEDVPADRDALGRIIVDPHLQVPGFPNIFAAGDAAHAVADETHAALMSCQHASPMGAFAGRNAVRFLNDGALVPYAHPDYVTCLDLGQSGAVFTQGWDRQVQMVGEEAKALKRQINTQLIYPPTGSEQDILNAVALP